MPGEGGQVVGTIVVGYVPKPEGDAALRRAAEEAKLRGSRLVVVNSHRGGREFDGSDAVESETALDEVRRELTAAGVEHEIRQLVRGLDPADDLVTVAEELAAEFIVIGLRRRSPVGKLILGSNAQRVLLDAPCPVLAVKADADAAD
jgi:nucleotide-binding universal stress UspA family protein